VPGGDHQMVRSSYSALLPGGGWGSAPSWPPTRSISWIARPNPREGLHRGGAQGEQGACVRTVRRGRAPRRARLNTGVQDQGAEDRQAALPVRLAFEQSPTLARRGSSLRHEHGGACCDPVSRASARERISEAISVASVESNRLIPWTSGW